MSSESDLEELLQEVANLGEIRTREHKVTQSHSVHQIGFHVFESVSLEILLNKWLEKCITWSHVEQHSEIQARKAWSKGLTRKDEANNDQDQQSTLKLRLYLYPRRLL